jgi:hypothetical protein
MARKIIDIGTVGNDGTGDSIRDSFRKVNDNFRELYSSLGLGEKLTFINLDDTPADYLGQENAILSVNNTETGLAFKQLVPGSGISVDFTTNASEIRISAEFSRVSADPAPQLGGPLNAFSGDNRYTIANLPDLTDPAEFTAAFARVTSIYGTNNDVDDPGRVAVNKRYADSKISLAGIDGIDPVTGDPTPAFGQMTGPLILSRDPIPEDDLVHNGLVAATKRYVDNSAFGSTVNLYVATSGQDDRVGVSAALQGRALAYAYRTIEAACKRAEELILESRLEIGPYKKLLTYNQGASFCTLAGITEAPASGGGFLGHALMSVDTVAINNLGVNYKIGDILTVSGGTATQPARYQVLSITEAGGIISVLQLSSGVYTALPGSTNIATTDNSAFGAGATFDLTYKVNNVIVDAGGSGYGLVSVRIIPAPGDTTGSGAFGTADVVGGIVQSITITDQGSNFTALPSVIVNLPRFLIRTDFYRTDFTGDVLTNTPTAIRGRDIREGLYLRGETSGALAQILAHQGALDSDGNEIFDVDIKYGSFQDDEIISYGDVARQKQISILVESGIYEENLPIRIPVNTSIVGDEFRRVIIRPKPGRSSSPWAFIHFRRDLTVGEENTDLLTVADRLFGYHYLTNSGQPVYPIVNNKGYYRSAAQLLLLNREFIQKEVIGWISHQVQNNIDPFTSSFEYDAEVCERDVGLIIDSMIFDLRYGGSSRTISAALKYFGNASGLVAINDQLSETVAGIRRINTLAQLVIRNVEVTEIYQTAVPQIVDGAYISEVGAGGTSISISGVTSADPVVVTTSSAHGLSNGDQILISEVGGTTAINGNDYYVEVIDSTSVYLYNDLSLTDAVDGTNFGAYTSGGYITNNGGVIGALTDVIIDVISGSVAVNYPKNNNEMDVFLCNDAVRFQAVTFQGHGGFAMVLDPEGQILAKSPYAQECASFSRSTGRQTFAGGQYVDGFTGNLKFRIISKDSNTFLRVGDLMRMPQLPASFIVRDTVYRINYVRDFVFNPAGSTASLVLDESTPWPFDVFSYDDEICSRDVGLIIDGLGYDIALGTNYHARKSGLSYRQANAHVVVEDQLQLTLDAIEFAHTTAYELLDSYPAAQSVVQSSELVILDIIENGTTFAPTLTFTNPTGLSSDLVKAKNQLVNNVTFIKDEVIGYINSTYPSLVYDSDNFSRDIQYIIEALIYDLIYGGNSETRKSGLRYYDGVGNAEVLQIPSGQLLETSAGILYASYLAQQVIQNLPPATTYSLTTRTTGPAATATEATTINTLLANVNSILLGGTSAAAAEVLPTLSAYPYATNDLNARTILVTEKADIQQAVIDYVDENANVYEILMPGNRSMLSNDFTQINDLGYGIVVNNGGLVEAVSMFTYYCHISYYSMGGGQIRSVAGSSAHGNYALVAQGADPLEVPTPVTLYYDLGQGITCYYPSGTFANTLGGLVLFVTYDDYVPLDVSELEVDHGLGQIYRYPVVSVSTADLPAGVARLGLRSSEGTGTDGLAAVIPDGTRMTIRQNAQVVLTGDVVDVAVRPSTGLVLAESVDVYRILQFENYTDPSGGYVFTISIASPAVITRASHGLKPGYQFSLSTTGSLPTGVDTVTVYYVLSDEFTANSFRFSATKNGSAIVTSGSQSGTHSYLVEGLARTTLRENYNYVDLSLWSIQPYSSSSQACTITIASPAVVTAVSHGFVVGDVIRFETTGSLPGGISINKHYFVTATPSLDTFRFSDVSGVSAVDLDTFGSQSGTHVVGKVKGYIGDDTLAVTPLGTADSERVLGTKFVWKGTTHTISSYSNETVTGEPYGLITFSPALADSAVYFTYLPTFKSATLKHEPGTLTIRISLTRVTSHDLLEIGTGSYADTNYPNEIYGPPVNSINDANETEERGVGRVFYVTTDQFGNFSVGPYFRVDQGTGTVTFAAAIALSNLDGIGFKRGVPVSEFSTDTGFSDNATDTVPTENATRGYLDRRLGLSHTGDIISSGSLIPAITGGFMALDGQLAMKADMDIGGNKIENLADPTGPQDAVNLRSLVASNFQEFDIVDPRAGDLLVYTGNQKDAENASVVGDISLSIDSTAHTIDAQINPGVIVNADINASAAIIQSKLSLQAATTRANATGITQADRGLASFDSAQFDVTGGWVTLKDNGIALSDLPQVATKTVLGNTTLITNNVSAVPFTDVVNDGGAIKKSQFSSGTGYLRRIGFTFNNDTDYAIVDESSANTASTLVKRDSNGDFAARNISVERLVVDTKTVLDTTTSLTGGYTQVYGFLGQVGILIGDGSVATDKRSFYDNDGHTFRTQNGLANAPIVCSSVQATLLTTGAVSTAGTVTGNWSLSAGSRFQATYADLAEYYEGDREYEVGTVLVFGGDKEVTTTTVKMDTRVAGVVSDTAAYTMNSACPGYKNLIALQGRVKCKVVGRIRKGDILVTTGIPGVAGLPENQAQAGTIIGKSLQDYDSDHIGTIEVAVGRT